MSNPPSAQSFSVRQGEYNGEMSPIPISQILFAKIAQYARIPLVYSEILSRNTAMTVHATPQLPPTYPPLSPANIRKEYLSTICHTNYNR